MKKERPRVLIEDWLPVAAIGAESQRERGASSALPPLYFLHVWWARRPLIASRAAVLASVLPAYSDDWPQELKKKFPTEKDYHNWFLRFIGIQGDPAAGRKLIQFAKEKGVKLPGNPYGYARAFTSNPEDSDLKLFQSLLGNTWENGHLSMIDPMAGGGSIPFEALRYGFTVNANELNPVASIILKATLDYPAYFGNKLIDEIKKYGKQMADLIEERLKPYFPRQRGESIFAYIWARTVACPATGKPVPLSPNWWLQKGSSAVAARLLTDPKWKECRFEIIQGEDAIKSNPDKGTINRGTAISPWNGDTIDGDYIKSEAQAGRMGQQLYALGIKTANGKFFRSPSDVDLKAITQAEKEFQVRLPLWESKGLIPSEDRYVGPADRSANYGMIYWFDAFAPRQLLSLITCMEVLKEVMHKARKDLSKEMLDAVQTYLALAIDKCADYNSRMVRWHSSRGVIAGTFDRHDFSFKWSHAEFDAAHNLFGWALSQILDAYKGISSLVQTSQLALFKESDDDPMLRLSITQGNAQNLSKIKTGSIHLVCVDPPYYDNVMYSECSDFFYVWMKRTLGNVYPEFFIDELTDKDNEAVANVARFESVGRGSKRELAEKDYERKMAACFKEMNRVLHPDGVLTVMFTHKKVEAWDSLSLALIGAGFSIEASWPIHTESEHSLHQAKKNAAASTILLVCRKRTKTDEEVWWDDIQAKVREVAREKAAQFHEAGISGVDLYLSTFGPVLSVISQQWPVLTSEVDEKTGSPKHLRPDTALKIAREEVIALRKQGLLLGQSVQFDPVTDWVLMAWDAFRAEQFPADEARKLALALGLDIEQDLIGQKKVITKKQNFVAFQLPKNRRRKGLVDPDAKAFPSLIDAIQTAMLIYEEDGSKACEVFLKNAGLLNDAKFKAGLQAMVNAVPWSKEKGKFKRPEAASLEAMCLTFFEDISLPVEEEPALAPEQMKLFGKI
jgi:putative DNA methylase